MSLYRDTPFASIFDTARAERALDNYKLSTPPNYQLEAARSGCNREAFKLLQKYTTTSFFSHFAGQEIMKYLTAWRDILSLGQHRSRILILLRY